MALTLRRGRRYLIVQNGSNKRDMLQGLTHQQVIWLTELPKAVLLQNRRDV
jgi:hypothetical protein